MLQIFRLNDPYRLGLVFIIMLALRLPHWLVDSPLTWHEQHWLLLGQSLSEGHGMYSEVWDTTGPIPALVYSLLHTLFGRSAGAHQGLALVVLFIQCIIFNTIMTSRKAYNESTYVPGMMYGLLGSLYFDFFTLSPVLIGTTFVLLSYRQLFSHLQSRAKEDEAILLMGMMMGMAALCYLPLALLIIPLYIALGIFSNTVPRRYVLILYGGLLPLLMSGIYYYIVDALPDFINFYLFKPFTLSKSPYASWLLLGSIFILPFLFFILAAVRTFSYPRFVNYQSRLQQIMVLWFFTGIFLVIRAYHRSPLHLIILVPPMAFFFSHYLLLIRRRRWAELAFTVIAATIVLTSLSPRLAWMAFLPDEAPLQVSGVQLPPAYQQKSMWVIGDYPAYYQFAARQGTPFYQSELIQGLMPPLTHYGDILLLHETIGNELPEVVVDPEGHFPNLLHHYPDWQAKYQQVPGNDQLWVRNP